MSNDPIRVTDSYELALYKANLCPAEILLPYSLSTNERKFFPFAFINSKFKQSLWNMDSPLVLSIVVIISMHLIATFLLAILSVLDIVPAVIALRPLGLVPLSFLLLTFPLYAIIVGSNLAIGGGRNWHERLLGPTNIGLTESGFKLWWQGSAFYNYPNLAVWSDIFYLDLIDDEQSKGQPGDKTLHFVYQSGFGRRTVELPLRGFETREDAQMVLSYFARFVLPDNQSEEFREQVSLNFEGALKSLDFKSDITQLSTDA